MLRPAMRQQCIGFKKTVAYRASARFNSALHAVPWVNEARCRRCVGIDRFRDSALFLRVGPWIADGGETLEMLRLHLPE